MRTHVHQAIQKKGWLGLQVNGFGLLAFYSKSTKELKGTKE